jgi:putative transposase
MKDSLWSIDLFRCASATSRTHWVLVVMDQYSHIIGFGVHAGTLHGVLLCKVFNRAIRGHFGGESIASEPAQSFSSCV